MSETIAQSLTLTADAPRMLLFGLLTGVVFGFLLQKAWVTRYRVILGQFLWVDHTVLRTMLTAVVVGSIGVYAMHQMWGTPLHLKNATIWGNVLGGAIFGVGMAILGYCPGTAVGAMAEGSRHAIPGVLGMLVGAGLYAEVEPWVSERIFAVWDLEKVTLPQIMHVSPWVLVIGMVIVAAGVFAALRDRDRGRRTESPAPPEVGKRDVALGGS